MGIVMVASTDAEDWWAVETQMLNAWLTGRRVVCPCRMYSSSLVALKAESSSCSAAAVALLLLLLEDDALNRICPSSVPLPVPCPNIARCRVAVALAVRLDSRDTTAPAISGGGGYRMA